MTRLGDLARKIPLVYDGYVALRDRYARFRYGSATAEDVFTRIFQKNVWGSKHSVSGRGSDLDQTRIVVQELPAILRKFGVKTLLDIPCGDFHWMQTVDLRGLQYIGADLVTSIVENNERLYASEQIRFSQLDLATDPLPPVDLVFCRDCLVHLSYRDIFAALHSVVESRSTYFMSTTFVDRKYNRDITTGQWRALNLAMAPFDLPPPLLTLNEKCTEGNGKFSDKSLALWRVQDIAASVQTFPRRGT